MSKWFLLLSAFFFVSISSIYSMKDAPQISKSFPKELSQSEDSVLNIPCSVTSGSTPFSFKWLKNNQELQPTGNQHSTFQIKTDNFLSIFSISQLKPSDSGNYSCVVSNNFGIDIQWTQLQVKVPPSWIKEPKDVNLRMGEEYSVECLADGLPKPKIKWLTPSGKTIENEILDLSKLIKNEKNGRQTLTFECVADNGIGEALRKSITISYNVPARFDEKYSSIQAKKGDIIVLKCNATGDRPITIRWTKDGMKLDRLSHHHHYEMNDFPTSYGVISELSIRSVQKTDGAIYKCDAENEHGRDDRTIKLLVVEEPSSPVNVKINEVWSRSASVSWRHLQNGNSPVTRYLIQYWRRQNAPHRLNEVNVSSSQTSFLIKNLSPGLSYELSVIAENEVGRSEPSETVPFFTGEEEPSAPPNDINVEPKGPTTIRITWRAPPKEFWNGLIKGYYVGFRKAEDSNQAYTLKSIDSKYTEANQIENEVYEYFLRDLSRGTEYEIVIKAYNMAGSGPQSHVLLARTLDGDLPPAQHLIATETTTNSISLRWHQRDNRDSITPIISYTLQYQKEGEPKWHEIPFSTLATSSPSIMEQSSSTMPIYTYTLSNLESGVHYRIFVTAVNRFGFSDPSNIVFTKTIGERLNFQGKLMNHLYYENPYYMQPEFTIPIITAFVIVFIIMVVAYVCVRRAKHRAAANSLILDGATLSKQFTGYSTGPRYADFDKVSGKPLIMTEQGNIFPAAYATMPMDENMQPWTGEMKKDSHIYDHPQ
ncbi:cell adhesion molecule Dscam1-like isoform X2 [Dermatophagoides pteronyssinus]|uniref:cell adhesion molecule Dscam1-like isoform X2 n=1 Tax=Dermatophagoides pteronyssinus TaxID=6956 RepID=UPI003F674EFD